MARNYADETEFFRTIVWGEDDTRLSYYGPYTTPAAAKGMGTREMNDKWGSVKAFKIQKLVAVLANKPIDPNGNPEDWGSSLVAALTWVDYDG